MSPDDQPTSARTAGTILHFVGVNGAGKSTLALQVSRRLQRRGKTVIRDSEHYAYNPAFDRTIARLSLEEARLRILDRAVSAIESWADVGADVVIVDRWHESYDQELLPEQLSVIEAAVRNAGFALQLVHLVVGKDGQSDDFATMFARTAHTRANRPEAWWLRGEGTIAERTMAECAYQQVYRQFCARSPFPSATICTTDMDWAAHEAAVLKLLSL